MIPIWKPLSKIKVVESNSSVIKPESTGFIVLLSEDGYGYRNYWSVDVVFTRNGKKGQRRIAYRRVRTKKLNYEDHFTPQELELVNSKDRLRQSCFEPTANRTNDYVLFADEPYKAKDLLRWDSWDFLGWLGAASQLCQFMVEAESTLYRMVNGLPAVRSPGAVTTMFNQAEGGSISLLDIAPEDILALLMLIPTITKENKTALIKAFDDDMVRLEMITKCRRALAYGHKIYSDILKKAESIHKETINMLMLQLKQAKNPKAEKESKEGFTGYYKADDDTLIKLKRPWRTATGRTISRSNVVQVVEEDLPVQEQTAPEPTIVVENSQPLTIDVSTIGGGTETLVVNNNANHSNLHIQGTSATAIELDDLGFFINGEWVTSGDDNNH